MKIEEYLDRNKQSIKAQCQDIADQGSNAVITVKEDSGSYVHQVSTVEKFTEAMPDNKFFKKMRDGITNAVLNKVVPIVIFEGQKAQIVSLREYFELKK